ncbi:restriction endonuclease subunit S (plasmid) [Aquincola tertiaricarbonis]|uniref:Restriction endonuclease subunit S n=1 Tax=Aquincola tertiaricarbonis TaxID=391953 RepID=A0ABY4SHE1_AQUTE|nr:restriction endonuclease subunit S [Aquincola tertiaricarbonis]URI11980.1 restriction endonuclease subunit S [Aquincola tertiaricarbonis]
MFDLLMAQSSQSVEPPRIPGRFREPKPYLRNLNVRWFDFDLTNVLQMRFEASEAERYTVRKGDLVICEGGYPGRAAVWDFDEPVYFQKALHRVRFHDPGYARWCLYYLLYQDVIGQLRAHFNGAGIQHFTGEALAKFEIPVPPIDEACRLVALLDEAFEGIATAKANTEKSLQNAREWSARQLATALGAASVGGRSDTLEKLVAPSCTLSYGIVQPGEDVPDGLPVVRPVDLGDRNVYANSLKRIDPALARSYARTTLEGNDLLLCVRGTTGTVAVADPALAGANVTRGIVPIRFDPQTISQALGYYLLRSEPVQAQIRAKTYGTALMQINIGDLRKIVVAFPPLEEQAALVEKLDAIQEAADQLADVYARKLAALTELKHSLLHQAFTGGLSPQNDRPLRGHDLPLCTQ